MIACKVSIFFTFLFVGLFAFGLSYENGTEHNSLESYGDASCTLLEVSSRLEIILTDADLFGGPAGMSYNDTLRLVRQITGLYFTSSCGAPIFYNLYDKFSNVDINMDVAAYVHNGMVDVMTKVNQIMDSTNSIPIEDLLLAIYRVAVFSSVSFTFAYNYAPIQWLICNQWLALSVLATRAPGANQTAMEELLKNTIDTCSSQLNRKEHEMLAAYDSYKFYTEHDPILQEMFLDIYYLDMDDFHYKYYCSNDNEGTDCMNSCVTEELLLNYIKNPFIKTYSNVFNDGYCKMRKTFSLYNNSDNVIAAKCLDSDYYVEKDFLTLKWHSKIGETGPISKNYDKGNIGNTGIYLGGVDENVFLDLMNGKVQNDTAIKCTKVEFLTRCDLSLPPAQGPCA